MIQNYLFLCIVKEVTINRFSLRVIGKAFRFLSNFREIKLNIIWLMNCMLQQGTKLIK